jgi:glycosyltransferase involved in cell wall biosynthesis
VKVAYYSPLPPDRSGIADYSAHLLPALAERVDVVVARRGRFRRPPRADLALYHVGNDPAAHGWIVDALRRRPGVVVMHEFVLHHLVSGITLARGDVEGYLAALEREAGPEGRELGQAVQQARIEPLWETRPQDFPLAGEVLDLATGLIVHSRYVEDRARAAGYAGPIWRIPMPAWPAPLVEPAPVEGDPLFACFGHINESKRIPQLLRAFEALRERLPGARLLLVGTASDRMPRFETGEGVIREEYVPEDRLWALMLAADVHVCLRRPTMGETSAVAIRALSAGNPLVVNDVGWFSELPDEVAVKVPAEGDEVDLLTAALEELAADPERRARMGAAALTLANTEYRLGRVADLYASALREAFEASGSGRRIPSTSRQMVRQA